MDEKELNEAICNIMFWYKDTPMAIPQKIVELIIKDRKKMFDELRNLSKDKNDLMSHLDSMRLELEELKKESKSPNAD